jgi:hypothetical protein
LFTGECHFESGGIGLLQQAGEWPSSGKTHVISDT